MTYVRYTPDNTIAASATWPAPGMVPAREEVVRNEEGQLVYKSDLDEAHEQAIRDQREAERIAAEEAQAAEEARVPDLEDAVAELGTVMDEETTTNSDAIVDLAEYVAFLEERITALEGGK